MNENYSLLFLNNIAEAIDYKTQGFGSSPNIPERDRQTHGEKLIAKFEELWRQVGNLNVARLAVSLPVKNGTYLEFQSAQNFDLMTKSLEDSKSKIRLLNLREIENDGIKECFATVFVPSGKEQVFIKKIKKYLTEIDKRSNLPKNLSLVNSIEDVRLAFVDSFWTDPLNLVPNQDEPKFCELWLRVTDRNETEVFDDLNTVCDLLSIELIKDRVIRFPERIVCLIKATKGQLGELIESFSNIAEIRAAKQTAGYFININNKLQSELSENLLKRLIINDTGVRVCILDTGVNNGHPLVEPILDDSNMAAFDSTWGIEDHNGHGTLMSGVAGYGSLEESLDTEENVILTHRLSSVKILPPRGANDPDLYGAITQQSISLAEINSPNDKLHFCCAITSPDIDHRGKPTSWSSAIDSITSGQEDNEKRLYIVSAGNVENLSDWENYPNSNLLISVQDPAQSWNALTVGAFTEKVSIKDPTFINHEAVAPMGGLSPFSTCSTLWDSKWPLKPEIVMEGGNLRKAPDGSLYENHPDLSVLTTSNDATNAQFDTIFATSAATAKAAWVSAKIQSAYPNLWPESVKGLMIHSAEWPNSIIQQFNLDISKKNDVQNLMRICGYGVPNLENAIYCASNYLTLLAQEEIQPFKFNEENRPVTNDMHCFELPWPKDELISMGATQVKIRITLCYFIEPGPGEIGWKEKYRYASHGLRFELNNVNDTKEEFIKRINLATREENESSPGNSGSERWIMGPNNRVFGSVHSDIWIGNAADVATCNMVGVYPVLGWWRERKHLGNVEKKTRYSLIVSLITPPQDVNIYTPVETVIRVPIPIERS